MGSAMSQCAGGLHCSLTLSHRDWSQRGCRVAVGAEMGCLVDMKASCPCLRFLHKHMGQGYTPMPPLTLSYKIITVLFCPSNTEKTGATVVQKPCHHCRHELMHSFCLPLPVAVHQDTSRCLGASALQGHLAVFGPAPQRHSVSCRPGSLLCM